MIRLSTPFTDDDELSEMKTVFETGHLTQGPKTEEFEASVKSLLGCRNAVATSSATTALHLVLAGIGIGPGDEVLVSDFTYPASANVIIQTGARPVCVDVLPDTYAMDARDMQTRITERTKAVIVVHPFGLSADMNPIEDIAKKNNLFVLEDAACALGSKYKGNWCGTIGDAGCYSFHPRKSITTGEGGMMVTELNELATKAKILRSHGGVLQEHYFSFEEAGFNYKISDISAAVGVAQLRKLHRIIEQRRDRAYKLGELLADIDFITLPHVPADCYHTFQSYVITLDKNIDRDKIIHGMRQRGVETTIGTYALHSQPIFRRKYQYKPGILPESHRLFRSSLTLPTSYNMTEEELGIISASLKECLKVEAS